MSKPIIHIKYDYKDVNLQQLIEMSKELNKQIGSDYHIVFTPFEVTCPSHSDLLISFDGINITAEDIINFISNKN